MPKIAVNGTELYYQLEGSGPVLVLANGIFQRVEAWEPLMPHLQGLTVLRYDMRGQGRSAVPEGAYTPELHAQDLRALLEALGMERYHLLGLSNGGVVAQVFASHRPRGLQSLILLCTTPRLDPLIRAKVESWRLALEWDGSMGRLRVALPWIWGRAYLEAHPEVDSPPSLEQMLLAAPSEEAQRNLIAGFLTLGDLRPRLASIAVPTLVISGEEDLLFPPRYGQEIAQAIPGARHHTLSAVGHVAALEDTPGLARLLHEFLEVKA
ncbi:alpha/beta fold hydrolase [Calidithermus timidus]|jgi:3-oxoadipate enol-lactonase|uniref:alpha/beta fold hydrolase n=1 Tax=Calidithermus timidus TaxID=307124 RepID=UPI0003A94D4B|nr:alpha/beta fold hydrolase [Calidithermus timidus]